MIMNRPLQIKSFLPPTLITFPSGTYAISGSQWIPVPASTTFKEVQEAWVPMKSFAPEHTSSVYKEFTVPSSDGKSNYTVSFKDGMWSCTCTGFGFRRKCKHIDQAKLK